MDIQDVLSKLFAKADEICSVRSSVRGKNIQYSIPWYGRKEIFAYYYAPHNTTTSS